MDKKTVVIALGHEALGKTLPDQKQALKRAVKAVADLIQQDYNVVITHSNGPQVSMIHTAMTEFGKKHEEYTVSPMSICSAMSQGYIGYDLQNTLREELLDRGIFKTVVTLLTQVCVDAYDEAFDQPAKPIGRYMTDEEAREEVEKNNFVVEEQGKGYRRIVAAPKPMDIVEIDAIRTLAEAGQVVIACGGGGIPVMEQGSKLKGASAVIEKDLAASKLAQMLNADVLLILTGEENVYLNYGKDNAIAVSQMNLDEARQYINEGQFEKETMLPKIEAAIQFCEGVRERKAIITSIEKAVKAVERKTGTEIKFS